ncbi:hypothetical protein UY3_09894 [Chelonia mydas]|uniref:Uncharacterized protein n=1 Tax=Chelonia mydas TaxID=8469 RepID=M7BBM4_CHEMY|nr:hypothetical protein UY3_09894 [Chelonia mydas]
MPSDAGSQLIQIAMTPELLRMTEMKDRPVAGPAKYGTVPLRMGHLVTLTMQKFRCGTTLIRPKPSYIEVNGLETLASMGSGLYALTMAENKMKAKMQSAVWCPILQLHNQTLKSFCVMDKAEFSVYNDYTFSLLGEMNAAVWSAAFGSEPDPLQLHLSRPDKPWNSDSLR